MNYYIFDLDNTLYSPKNGLFKEVDKKINEYLKIFLGFSEKEVNKIRKKYWIKFGTTLNGLMRYHNINPIHYLEFVHDVDIEKFLNKDCELKNILNEINGKKIIFTNGYKPFAIKVLKQLGIYDIFDEILDIEWMDFIPKPNFNSYRKLINFLKCKPEKTIFFDDFYLNLLPAKRCKMRTVLVKQCIDHFDFVDFHIENIKNLKNLKINIDF